MQNIKSASTSDPQTPAAKLTLAASLLHTVSLAHSLMLYDPEIFKEQAFSVAETTRFAGQLVLEVVEGLPIDPDPNKK